MPFIDPLYISSAYGSLINRNQTIGGIVQYGRENYKIYYEIKWTPEFFYDENWNSQLSGWEYIINIERTQRRKNTRE
mgnify:CR=1 FL=1